MEDRDAMLIEMNNYVNQILTEAGRTGLMSIEEAQAISNQYFYQREQIRNCILSATNGGQQLTSTILVENLKQYISSQLASLRSSIANRGGQGFGFGGPGFGFGGTGFGGGGMGFGGGNVNMGALSQQGGFPMLPHQQPFTSQQSFGQGFAVQPPQHQPVRVQQPPPSTESVVPMARVPEISYQDPKLEYRSEEMDDSDKYVHQIYRCDDKTCADIVRIKLDPCIDITEATNKAREVYADTVSPAKSAHILHVEYDELYFIGETYSLVTDALKKLLVIIHENKSHQLKLLRAVAKFLKELPTNLADELELLLLRPLNDVMNNGVFYDKSDNFPIFIKLKLMSFVCDFLDRTTENSAIVGLMNSFGSTYFDFISGLINNWTDAILSIKVCHPDKSEETSNILKGYRNEEVDGVTAKDILDSALSASMGGSATNGSQKLVENNKKFLRRYTVLRLPKCLLVSNVLSELLINRFNPFSQSSKSNRPNPLVINQPTNIVEWYVMSERYIGHINLKPIDNSELHLVSNLNVDGDMILTGV